MDKKECRKWFLEMVAFRFNFVFFYIFYIDEDNLRHNQDNLINLNRKAVQK